MVGGETSCSREEGLPPKKSEPRIRILNPEFKQVSGLEFGVCPSEFEVSLDLSQHNPTNRTVPVVPCDAQSTNSNGSSGERTHAQRDGW